jgi:formylglycine-generating enzyme required for sulfatase activity
MKTQGLMQNGQVKRLPTELEWQYAAQTPEMNEWPWRQTTPVKRKIEFVNATLSATSIEGIDSAMCNLGDSKLNPVGSFSERRQSVWSAGFGWVCLATNE